MKYLLVTYITFLTLVLASCESADRGGVTLTPKPAPPSIQPPPSVSGEPLSIISATAMCLAVYEPDFLSANDGSKVQTVYCVPNSIFQSWRFTPQREILSDNGQCLSPGGVADAGTLVVLKQCDGSIDQKWVLDAQSVTIRPESNANLCLETPKLTVFVNGIELYLMPCHGEENQQWVAQKLTPKQFTSAFNSELSISIKPNTPNGLPHLAAMQNDSAWLIAAAWTLEPVGNFYRIRNLWKPDRFLHVEHGFLEAGTISPYWDSAIWTIIRQDDSQGEAYLLRNLRLNNIYIGLDEDQVLKAGTLSELVDGSTLWRVIDVNEGF